MIAISGSRLIADAFMICMLGEDLKWLVKRLIARTGYQVTRISSEQDGDLQVLQLLSRLGITCVLDVGAHKGQYGQELRRMGYGGHIVSFEPVGANFAVLSNASRGDPRWRVFPFGLGERTSQVDINVFEGSTFHSLLSPSDYGRQAFGNKLRLERTERIEIKRLDEVLETCLEGIPAPRLFLKIDTQGYDLAVIDGAGAELDRVLAMQTEVALRPIYQDMRNTLASIVPELQRRGYEVTGLFPVSRDKRDGLQIIEVDCVMVRSEAASRLSGEQPVA